MATGDDDSFGLWGFCFECFVEPGNRRVSVSDAQRDKLVADMESRLARFAGEQPDQYHPAGAETAARQLATYYRRLDRKTDVERALRTYGGIVRRMNGTAAPLIVGHSLEQLYDMFNAFGLRDDANGLNELLRAAGEATAADLKSISVEANIPTAKVEQYFAELLAGTADEVLRRIAKHFIPRRDEIETQLRDLARQAPISFMMSRTIVDEDGRPVARIGPLESDLEGHVLGQIGQNMQIGVMWLREAMARGFERKAFSARVLEEFLFGGALFQGKRRAILVAGLDAYARGEAIAAIHVLVPQFENALRQLAVALEAPIYTQRRGGGLHCRTLEELLRDEEVSAALGVDLTTYFRALFTDPRAWNIRNDVCHGLATGGMLSLPIADRVVHALLVLALMRNEK